MKVNKKKKGGYVDPGCELTREIIKSELSNIHNKEDSSNELTLYFMQGNGITALSLTFVQTQLQLLSGVTKRNKKVSFSKV